MMKNITLIVLTIVSVVSIWGWVTSAQEAHSNAIVMHSEAQIIRNLKGIE